jgi:hypothetical protein
MSIWRRSIEQKFIVERKLLGGFFSRKGAKNRKDTKAF